MQKKIVSILIFSFFWTGLLKAQSVEINYLQYWTPFSGGDARPMKLLVDRFNNVHPEIQVQMKILRWSDYYPALERALQNGEAPDIAIIHTSALKKYAQAKQLYRLDDADIAWDDFALPVRKAIAIDNHYMALPLDIHPLVFFFNKTYLKEAKLLDADGKPLMEATPEGFVAFLKLLKQRLPKDVLPFSSANTDVYPFWIWYSLYHQMNADGAYIKDNRAAFNNEAGKKALQVLQKLRDAKVWDSLIHDEKGYNLFKYNKAATMVSGVWATWNFQQNRDLDFSVMTFPRLFDHDAVFGDGHTLALPKQPKRHNKHTAITFIKWLSKESLSWSESGQIPANKNVVQKQDFLQMPFRDVYMKAAQHVVFLPQHAKIKACNGVMIETLVDFMRSSQTVEEALSGAQIKIDAILSH